MSKVVSIPSYVSFTSFEQAFDYLNGLNRKFAVVFDEYPYLKKMNDQKTVDSVFQDVFDNYSSNLNFIICGSEISMMGELLKEGNPLFGRFTKTIYVGELNYIEASSFYTSKSIMDKIAFYAIFGGSPYINAFIDESDSLENNIKRLFLDEGSPVYAYTDSLLISDAVNSLQAKKIIAFIGNGKKKYSEIESHIDPEKTGKIAKSLKSLLSIKLLKKTYPVNRPTDDKKAYYEINDNVLRFFLHLCLWPQFMIVSIGKDSFYEAYTKDSLVTFISHRFEEIARDYFSLLSAKGLLKG